MKKMLPMFLAAFVVVFCCACNAVTPGPSTTRSTAAQVSVSTAAPKESSGRAQKSTDSAEETEEETTGETGEETEETTEETGEDSSRKSEEDQTDGETLYVISAVNVRDAATKKSNVVGTLSAGESVTKLGEDGSWTKILYKGEECYVSSNYLSDKQQ